MPYAQNHAAPLHMRFESYLRYVGVEYEHLDDGEKGKLNECFSEGAD